VGINIRNDGERGIFALVPIPKGLWYGLYKLEKMKHGFLLRECKKLSLAFSFS
jgi:hypothetical protein